MALPRLGAPSVEGPSSCRILLLASAGRSLGSVIRPGINAQSTITSPAMHKWHGRRHNCIDHTLDLIAYLPVHIEGA